jgi:hypothetical protein
MNSPHILMPVDRNLTWINVTATVYTNNHLKIIKDTKFGNKTIHRSGHFRANYLDSLCD